MTHSRDDDAAIQLDLYLDRVLSGAVPMAVWEAPDVDRALLDSASLVARGATRFHPSFRFEERLARRLRDASAGPEAEPAMAGILVPFGVAEAVDRARPRRVGGVLVGGAIASGVSLASLAGAAALVVWRRARWVRPV